ncbi:MAG TPA: hypothetical protein VFP59_00770 [Candidatus Angelobacter sp.]|nr:hypothetical protein [Candidatus Angelobacter sp.]
MSETLFALWIALSATLLLLFLYAVLATLRNRQCRPVALDELVQSFAPVDIDAFTELVSEVAPGEVSAKELLTLQWQRRELAIDFLKRMNHNAALLQRLGYSQLQSGNPLIMDLAQQMIDAGVHVRLYTLIGLTALRVSRIFSFGSVAILSSAKLAELQRMMSGSLIPAYEQLREKTGNLTCLKFSALHEAVIQNL